MYKRVFLLFLYGNFEYKKDVYEKSMEINNKPLPENYIERLKYEQEEMTAMFKYILTTETELFKPCVLIMARSGNAFTRADCFKIAPSIIELAATKRVTLRITCFKVVDPARVDHTFLRRSSSSIVLSISLIIALTLATA